jgi:hypothetical protein
MFNFKSFLPLWFYNTALAVYISLTFIWVLLSSMDVVHTKNPMKMFCISAFVICVMYFKRKLKIAQLAGEKAKEEQLKKDQEELKKAE